MMNILALMDNDLMFSEFFWSEVSYSQCEFIVRQGNTLPDMVSQFFHIVKALAAILPNEIRDPEVSNGGKT